MLYPEGGKALAQLLGEAVGAPYLVALKARLDGSAAELVGGQPHSQQGDGTG